MLKPGRTARTQRTRAFALVATLQLGLAFIGSVAATEHVAEAATETDRKAAKLFHDGEKAFAAGDYRKAAEAFEGAYKTKPHHAPLWNAAQSWDKAGEAVHAANLLEKYLAEAPAGARDRDRATNTLRNLQGRLGRVEVKSNGVDRVRVDDHEVEGASVVYVTPGEHLISGYVGDKQVRRVLHLDAGQALSVTLSPPQETGEAPPPPPPKLVTKGISPVFFVVSAALAAVATGFTVASGLDTVAKKDAFLADKTQPNLDSAFSAQRRTNIMIGVSLGLGVITGIVAVFVNWKGKAVPEEPTDETAAVTGKWFPLPAPTMR